jgi:hypothetical protein
MCERLDEENASAPALFPVSPSGLPQLATRRRLSLTSAAIALSYDEPSSRGVIMSAALVSLVTPAPRAVTCATEAGVMPI